MKLTHLSLIMADLKRVDLGVDKTEEEWGEAMGEFFLNATPLWFDWLKWVIIIGVIKVVADKTQDPLVQLSLGISYIFLMLYLMGFFYRIDFHIPSIKSEGKRLIISALLSGLLSTSIFIFLNHLTDRLTQ
jgi:hypothetical protein